MFFLCLGFRGEVTTKKGQGVASNWLRTCLVSGCPLLSFSFDGFPTKVSVILVAQRESTGSDLFVSDLGSQFQLRSQQLRLSGLGK